MEDPPEALPGGELLEGGAGVGHGRKARPGPVTANCAIHQAPEVAVEDVGLDGGPRLGGHEEQGTRRVDPADNSPDPSGHRGVEDYELGALGRGPKGLPQHLGPQAAAAHAEQHDVRVAVTRYFVGKGNEVRHVATHVGGQ